MKTKPVLEWIIYAAVIVLSLAALALVAACAGQFSDTKLVYQGF